MNRVLVIYIDTCIYSRLLDVVTQISVLMEVERIRHIMCGGLFGKYIIVGSFAVITEIGQNPNYKERGFIERLYRTIISNEATATAQCISRAAKLEAMGLGEMDSFHLAAAEAARADYLLTVDKDFIKKCSRPNFTTVKVINPINF